MRGTYINADCMDYLRTFKDGEFDLAIVDPPYGGSIADGNISCTRTGGSWSKKYQTDGGAFERDIRDWDSSPGAEYFDQLFRVSKNQIVWGANYFDLPPTRCFVIWRKTNIPLEGFTMSPCEYAWTSFNRNALMFEWHSSGTLNNPRFHPTQKPVELYKWLLSKFAEPGMRILDTHVGSASSLIACEQLGYEYVGFEIDETYYRLGLERMDRDLAQQQLF